MATDRVGIASIRKICRKWASSSPSPIRSSRPRQVPDGSMHLADLAKLMKADYEKLTTVVKASGIPQEWRPCFALLQPFLIAVGSIPVMNALAARSGPSSPFFKLG